MVEENMTSLNGQSDNAGNQDAFFIVENHSGQENRIMLRNILFLEDSLKKSVRDWRNSDEIRKYMYNNHIISPAEHEKFLINLKGSNKTKLFVLFYNDIPAGVVQFNDINNEDMTCEYGLYAVPGSKISGAYLEFCALSYAFEKLGIEKLNCTVFETNPHVISMHKKFGLSQEGILRKNVVRDGARIDIFCLGILKEEWNLKKDQMAKLLNIRG